MLTKLLLTTALMLNVAVPYAVAGSQTIPGFPSLYQSLADANCTAVPQCIASFERVPVDRLLQATHLNCVGAVSGSTGAQVVFILSSGKPENTRDYFVVPAGGSLGVNEPILTYFRSGERPKVILPVGGTVDIILHCNLSGTLLQP
jgi:hypothetical protein